MWKEKMQNDVRSFRNNEEMYNSKMVDAVFISTADFQHALHTIEAVKAGCDAYVEKPFAETMEDNRAALKAVKESGKIVQIGSQRRSGANYQAANDFIQSGKFGPITMVELTWNVNQPGRWRRPDLLQVLKEKDTDWKRFLMNRPFEKFDPRIYLEYRLFWPYSSGLPGQWMSHQIDTVHWFTGLKHPRSVVANGGIYQWKDGRRNWDTILAAFDYGPADDPSSGFQVTFASRMHNGDEHPSEIYYSNGGELNLITNKISPKGGLTEKMAAAMHMKANLLPDIELPNNEQVVASANTGGDSRFATLGGNGVANYRLFPAEDEFPNLDEQEFEDPDAQDQMSSFFPFDDLGKFKPKASNKLNGYPVMASQTARKYSERRVQLVEYRTKGEILAPGAVTYLPGVFINNPTDILPGAANRTDFDLGQSAIKNHHISEFSIVLAGGMRYVYGLPLYNRVHEEYYFAVRGGLPAWPSWPRLNGRK